jgi:hypothetical protein
MGRCNARSAEIDLERRYAWVCWAGSTAAHFHYDDQLLGQIISTNHTERERQ